MRSRWAISNSSFEVLELSIEQNPKDGDFSSFVWPSSRLLCAYIWEHRPSFRDARVVELGAGLPLPCVAALQAGARSVLATDVAYRDEHVARACRELAGDNRVPRDALRIRSLEWGQPEDVDSTGALGPFDWVLGADVLYDPKQHDALLMTISALLRGSTSSAALLAAPLRSETSTIAGPLAWWGLAAEVLEPPPFALREDNAPEFEDIVLLRVSRLNAGERGPPAATLPAGGDADGSLRS